MIGAPQMPPATCVFIAEDKFAVLIKDEPRQNKLEEVRSEGLILVPIRLGLSECVDPSGRILEEADPRWAIVGADPWLADSRGVIRGGPIQGGTS